MSRSLLVVTWDGVSIPFACVHADANPDFDILLFNYSGNNVDSTIANIVPNYCISKLTENKGQIFENVCYFIQQENQPNYEYIGVYDDDLIFKISDINFMLHLARVNQLDVFHSSVSHDSFFSHRQFLQKPSMILEKVDWVEIMAPFYRKEIFETCLPYFQKYISAHGIDCFIVPVIQRVLKMNETALIHAVVLKHNRPIRSNLRIYSNKLTSDEETELARQEAISLMNQKLPLFDSNFNKKVLKMGNPYLLKLEERVNKVQTLIEQLWLFARNKAN